MNDMDAVEILTTKLFEIKSNIKENDYLKLMNACKDIANARDPKIPHRLYCAITTHFTNNEEPDTLRTSFYLRIKLNEELDFMAFDSDSPIRLKHMLIDKGCRLDNIRQLNEIEYYYSKHFKTVSDLMRSNEVLCDMKIGETTLEHVFVRKERENEPSSARVERVEIYFPPPHPTHGTDDEYE